MDLWELNNKQCLLVDSNADPGQSRLLDRVQMRHRELLQDHHPWDLEKVWTSWPNWTNHVVISGSLVLGPKDYGWVSTHHPQTQQVSRTRMHQRDSENLLRAEDTKEETMETQSRNFSRFLVTSVPLNSKRHSYVFIINYPFMFKLTSVGFCSMQPMSTNRTTIYDNVFLSNCDRSSFFWSSQSSILDYHDKIWQWIVRYVHIWKCNHNTLVLLFLWSTEEFSSHWIHNRI